jgi:hypothetical protein
MFEGDVDMALCGVQHDTYFADISAPQVSIDGHDTLGWIWQVALKGASYRCHHRHDPWFTRNLPRLLRIDGFDHRLLQIHHQHLAAYFRWTTLPRIDRPPAWDRCSPDYPLYLVALWRNFLNQEVHDLLQDRHTLETLCCLVLYQNFDFSDAYYDELRRILMRRYGRECIALCEWVGSEIPVTRDPDESSQQQGAHE